VAFDGLPRAHYAALLCDPPWRFRTWDKRTAIPQTRSSGCHSETPPAIHYETMSTAEIMALPVEELAGEDCSLFLWISWPMLQDALDVMRAWRFTFKTCGFCWIKAHAGQLDLLRDDVLDTMGTGYWTRANSEVCLLATRGKPKRLHADVRQAIIEPRREHSRKPDCVYQRIERLVAGPYLELFARARRPGWDAWGNEVGKFSEAAE
jgi:N6-adenosine-specific RNA methylase IME4